MRETSNLEALDFYDLLSEKEKKMLLLNAKQQTLLPDKDFDYKLHDYTGLIIVNSGQLRAFLNLTDGRQISLYHLLPKDSCIFTTANLLDGIDFDIAVGVDQTTVITHIDDYLIKDLMTSNLKVEASIYKMVSQKLVKAMQGLEDKISKPLSERVMNFLFEQAKLQDSFTIQISHVRIANQLCSSREVISKVLKKLANEQLLIIHRGTITLLKGPKN